MCVLTAHIYFYLALKEEEALAQALAHGDMGPGEELTPEEEEELRYPGENDQQSALEQVNCPAYLSSIPSSNCIPAPLVTRAGCGFYTPEAYASYDKHVQLCKDCIGTMPSVCSITCTPSAACGQSICVVQKGGHAAQTAQ